MAKAQPQLPGTQDKKNDLLSRLVRQLVEANEEKADATSVAKERHDVLVLKMKEAKLDVYRDPETGVTVHVDTKARIKVDAKKGSPKDGANGKPKKNGKAAHA